MTYHTKLQNTSAGSYCGRSSRNYVKTCEVCQLTNDAKFVKESAPLHPIQVKPEVWRQALVGPLPETKSENRYITTLVEDFFKWPEAAALPDKTGVAVKEEDL